MDLADLYRDVIVDHNKRPRNFGRLEHPNRDAEGHNPLCGDRLHVFLDVEDDLIRDVCFEGKGCAISTASASLMTEAIKGKRLAEVRHLFEEVHDMLTRQDAPVPADLGKLAAASGVGAAVDSTLLPCSRSLRAAVTPPEARRFALAGGDDYELLFALPPGTDAAALGRGAGVGLARIGEFRTGRGVIIDGEPAPRELAAGFDHFASPRPSP